MNFKFPSSLDNPPPILNPIPNPNASYYTHQSIPGGFVEDDVNRREFNGYSMNNDVRSREFNGYSTSGDVSRREYNGYLQNNDVSRHYEGYPTNNDVVHRDFNGYSMTTAGDVSRREYEGYSMSGDVSRRDYEGYSVTNDVRHGQYEGYSQNAGSIQREIEKERIRKEIIAEEMMRRRVLEEEVRREMMMERETPVYRDVGGSYRESEYRGGYSTMPPFNRPVVGGSRSRNGSGVTLREITEVNGVVAHLPVVRKDKAIALAKPRGNLPVPKRKAMKSPIGGPSEAFKKQRTNGGWHCNLCQITTTSERGLNDHFRGKKHQALENGTVAHMTGFGTVPLPMTSSFNTAKPLLSIPSTSAVPKTSGISRTALKLKGASVGRKGNEKAETKASATQLKKRFRFFCEICQVGANTQTVFYAHKKGKKHLANVSDLNTTDKVTLIESSKEKAVIEENKELVGKKPEETTSSKKKTGKEKAKPAIGKPKKKFQFSCEMCQVGANSITVFTMHMKGKKHAANLLALNKSGETSQVESTQKAVSEKNVDLVAGEKTGGSVSKIEEAYEETLPDEQMALEVEEADMDTLLEVEGDEALAYEDTVLEAEGGETPADADAVFEVEDGETLAYEDTVLEADNVFEVEGGEALLDEGMAFEVEGVETVADTETVLLGDGETLATDTL